MSELSTAAEKSFSESLDDRHVHTLPVFPGPEVSSNTRSPIYMKSDSDEAMVSVDESVSNLGSSIASESAKGGNAALRKERHRKSKERHVTEEWRTEAGSPKAEAIEKELNKEIQKQEEILEKKENEKILEREAKESKKSKKEKKDRDKDKDKDKKEKALDKTKDKESPSKPPSQLPSLTGYSNEPTAQELVRVFVNLILLE
jgi:chemotaxis protein histidine kinase CheA